MQCSQPHKPRRADKVSKVVRLDWSDRSRVDDADEATLRRPDHGRRDRRRDSHLRGLPSLPVRIIKVQLARHRRDISVCDATSQFSRHRRDLLARRSVLPDPRLRRWESKTIHPRHHGRGERARRRAILPRPHIRPGGQGVLGSVVIVTSKNLTHSARCSSARASTAAINEGSTNAGALSSSATNSAPVTGVPKKAPRHAAAA